MKGPIFILTFLLTMYSCIDTNPNLDSTGKDVIESNLHFVDIANQNYQDTVYVPVYSDIYSETRSKSILLTATLSIRSTSLRDTTYINSLDYYNSHGEHVKSYFDKTLVLAPLQTIDYVIDQADNTGGTGANFLLTWGGERDTKPLFQCIMIGTIGQYGYAFTTDGISVKK